jgi:hypothetical protein
MQDYNYEYDDMISSKIQLLESEFNQISDRLAIAARLPGNTSSLSEDDLKKLRLRKSEIFEELTRLRRLQWQEYNDRVRFDD